MNLLNISFLAPIAFLGLIALAVPVYLHLRHKPRSQPFKFPAIEFLLQAQKKQKRRLRFEQLLLMIFRIAMLCLLALLFAKPFIDEQYNASKAGLSKPLVLILDDSASMLAGPPSRRFFDEALTQIRELCQARPSSSPIRLLLASNPQALLAQKDGASLQTALRRVQPTTFAAPLDAAYREALDLIAREEWGTATLRIFTDGSLTAWSQLPSEVPENVNVIYTSMRDEGGSFENVAMTKVRQTPGDIHSVEVHLFNSSAKSQVVKLTMAAETRVISDRVKLNPLASATHRFALGDPVPAEITLELSEDHFDLDNRIVFRPKTDPSSKVLIIDGDAHPEPIRNESFFLKNALSTGENVGHSRRVEIIAPGGLTPERVAASNVICLLNVDIPPTELLRSALRQGKGVFIAMGDRVNYESWNGFFAPHGLELWESKALLPPEPMVLKDPSHVLFHGIEESNLLYQNVVVLEFRLMSVGRSSFEIPLSLNDGSPLLLLKDLGPGRLAIWTSTADLDWTNFPLEFGYVPFAQQLMAYLAQLDTSGHYQSYTTTQVQHLGLADGLTLREAQPGFKNLAVQGPKPGFYTQRDRDSVQYVHVALDPVELNFKGFDALSHQGKEEALEELGFRSYVRSDLAPPVQWLLFTLLLLETLVAARMSLKWGSR